MCGGLCCLLLLRASVHYTLGVLSVRITDPRKPNPEKSGADGNVWRDLSQQILKRVVHVTAGHAYYCYARSFGDRTCE